MSLISDCCGAPEWLDETGICNECREHADWVDEDEEDEVEDLRDPNGENQIR